jgi:hypothetical protein
VDEKNISVIGITATVGFCVGLLLLLPVIRKVREAPVDSPASNPAPSAAGA